MNYLDSIVRHLEAIEEIGKGPGQKRGGERGEEAPREDRGVKPSMATWHTTDVRINNSQSPLESLSPQNHFHLSNSAMSESFSRTRILL